MEIDARGRELALLMLARAGVTPPCDEQLADLARRLRAATVAARARWPQLALDDEVFVRHIANRVARPATIDSLHRHLEQRGSDLYLAAAALHEVMGARDALCALVLSSAPKILRRMRLPDDMVDDAVQEIMERFFGERGDGASPLSRYSGGGPLLHYVAIIARQQARVLFRDIRAKRETTLDDTQQRLIEASLVTTDADIRLLKQRYQPTLRSALRTALGALRAKPRRVLLLRYVERLKLEEIGKLFGVSRTRASHLLGEAHAELSIMTKKVFAANLGMVTADVETLTGLVASGIDITLHPLQDSAQREASGEYDDGRHDE